MRVAGAPLISSGILKAVILCAAVTPFDDKGRPDPAQMARHLAWLESEGCAGAVIGGTNGEGPSISAVEKRDLLRDVQGARGKLALWMGVTTSSLSEAIWTAEQAAKHGAERLLVLPPTYFREATEEGLTSWFLALMEASPLPVVAYNFPQRSGFAFSEAFLQHLNEAPNFVGVKDSSGESANLAVFRRALPGKDLFVGDETLLLSALQAGWTGSISGVSNTIARYLVEVERGIARGDAEIKFELALPAIRAMRPARPALQKALLKRLGVIDRDDVRLPLTPLPDQDLRAVIETVHAQLGPIFGTERPSAALR